MFSLKNAKNILVFGGGRGLGKGLVESLVDKAPHATIHVTFRNRVSLEKFEHERVQYHRVAPLEEAELESLSRKLPLDFDLIANTIGVLEVCDSTPEKSLRSINLESMRRVFEVNAFIAPMIAKHFEKHFSKDRRSCFFHLSAMVGSLGENEIGGWYSYRASKAALNMFLKTVSIEWDRKKLPCSVLAIHPGTTKTNLSEKFLKGVKHKIWEPKESAQNILNVVEQLAQNEQTGKFYNWDGREISW